MKITFSEAQWNVVAIFIIFLGVVVDISGIIYWCRKAHGRGDFFKELCVNKFCKNFRFFIGSAARVITLTMRQENVFQCCSTFLYHLFYICFAIKKCKKKQIKSIETFGLKIG